MTAPQSTASACLLMPSPANSRTPRADSVPSAAATCPRPSFRRWSASKRASASTCTPADFQTEFRQQLQDLGGPPDGADLCRAAFGAVGREDLAEARGSRAHGRAQDQQRDRSGAARKASRRQADRRGDGRGTTWCGHARPRVPGLGLPCTVYMGAVDMERQAPNVGRMRLLGAKVVPVTTGDRTLRAAIDEALRDWVADPLGHLLHHRLGGGPASLSVSRARAAGRHRPRSARADARGGGSACRMC